MKKINRRRAHRLLNRAHKLSSAALALLLVVGIMQMVNVSDNAVAAGIKKYEDNGLVIGDDIEGDIALDPEDDLSTDEGAEPEQPVQPFESSEPENDEGFKEQELQGDLQKNQMLDELEKEPSIKDEPPVVQRIVPTSNFCRPDTYFSLDRITGGAQATGTLRIRQVTYNPSTFAITGGSVAIPSGNQNISLDKKGSVNSLAVTEDGIFYFTAQYRSQTWGSTINAYDVYRYELNAYNYANSTSSGQLTRVVTGGANETSSTFVAGAVDPTTGDFYFGYYTPTTGSNGRVTMSIYRHQPGTNSAVQIGNFRTAAGQHYDETAGNGDFAFNGDGDLIFVASGTSNAMTGTITRASLMTAIANGSASQNYDIPTSQISIHTGTVGGTAFNGIAYTAGGQLIVEQGNTNRIKRGINFSNLTDSATTITRAGTVGSAVTQLVDLASCHTPPVLTLQKNVEGRYNSTDQFTLQAEWHQTATGARTSLGTTTTTGIQNGIQTEKVGPKIVESNLWYTVSEASGNAGTNLNNYEKTLACTLNGAPVPVTAVPTGSQTNYRFQYPAVTTTQGGSLTCTFTNSELRPRLEVEKSADPVSGTAVEENGIVTYTLTFDNSAGTAPATVNHRDWLKDVLDDAFFIDAGGSQVASPVLTVSSGLSASFNNADPANPRIDITGTVGVGATSTVSFRVKVKPNLSDVDDRQNATAPLQGYLLRNYLTPASENTPPETCDDTTNMCTEHPVPAWTFEKTALPVSGAALHKGGNSHYRLVATKLNSSADIKTLTFTDDLTQVFKTAGWAPNAAVPGGALERGVYFFDKDNKTIDQSGAVTAQQPAAAYAANTVGPPQQDVNGNWILEETVTLPANAMRAELWFAVQAGETPVGIPAQLGIPNADPMAPISEPSSGWWYVNYATASAKNSSNQDFVANQCDTSTGASAGWWLADTSLDPRDGIGSVDPSVPVECRTNHLLDANYFTIRKDAAGVGEDLPRGEAWGTDTTGLWNMIGHEFEIRDNDNGSPSENQSKYLCRTEYNPGQPVDGGAPSWNGNFITGGTLDSGINSSTLAAIKAWNNVQTNLANTLPECAIAYPQQNAGGQTGHWKVENLPEQDKTFDNTSNAAATGDYWLIETKAPNAQRSLSGTQTRPVPGVQLLADPLPFKVWPLDDGYLWPDIPGQNQNEQARSGRGQLDMATSGSFGAAATGNYLDRCLPGGNVGSRPAACVNPTGYLMIVKDSVPVKLPLAGGIGTSTYILGGSMALAMALAGLMAWSRMQLAPATRGRYASTPPTRGKGRHGA